MITFGKFLFTIEALESIELPPHKCSALRGVLGHQLRKTVCITKSPRCEECRYLHCCIYAYIYNTPPPSDALMMKRYPTAPHPYVFEVPKEQSEKRSILPGERFSFTIILIGKAVEFLPHIIFAFECAGKSGIGKHRGRFYLKNVVSLFPDGNLIPIYEGRFLDKPSAPFSQDFVAYPLSTHSIEVMFETPARLKKEGKYFANINFALLVRNLLTRMSMLSYFHCGVEIKCNYKSLMEQAHKVDTESSDLLWKDINRYSSIQNTKMKLGGVIGKVKYHGNITPFLPYLEAGAHLHVGKSTCFGLGKYNYTTEE